MRIVNKSRRRLEDKSDVIMGKVSEFVNKPEKPAAFFFAGMH